MEFQSGFTFLIQLCQTGSEFAAIARSIVKLKVNNGGTVTFDLCYFEKSWFDFNFFFFFQVQPYNRKYRSIGHRVWSNILTELSVNLFKAHSAEPSAQSVIVMQF